MKENRISVKIRKSVNEVFDFTTNPENTPLWIESIRLEKAEDWPNIRAGSIYRNIDTDSKISVYLVSAFKKNELFELVSEDGRYYVRYTYKELEGGVTEMVYFERVIYGEISAPFTQSVLDKLKSVTESS